ncbi:MAG: hypothetical protein LUE24_14250 [Lachnospiraceae bacterium]|nr:hypothetical protein [Lachnospiraceae bacterium]
MNDLFVIVTILSKLGRRQPECGVKHRLEFGLALKADAVCNIQYGKIRLCQQFFRLFNPFSFQILRNIQPINSPEIILQAGRADPYVTCNIGDCLSVF